MGIWTISSGLSTLIAAIERLISTAPQSMERVDDLINGVVCASANPDADYRRGYQPGPIFETEDFSLGLFWWNTAVRFAGFVDEFLRRLAGKRKRSASTPGPGEKTWWRAKQSLYPTGA